MTLQKLRVLRYPSDVPERYTGIFYDKYRIKTLYFKGKSVRSTCDHGPIYTHPGYSTWRLHGNLFANTFFP